MLKKDLSQVANCTIAVPMWFNKFESLTATLTIRQARIVTSSPAVLSIVLFPVVGIATVELGGAPISRPTYYFECTTNLNNGSGIWWTRMSAQQRFAVESIPDGTGKRLRVAGIDYPDLDIYICSDQYSDDVASINITACECRSVNYQKGAWAEVQNWLI